jgi:hypothetical protein
MKSLFYDYLLCSNGGLRHRDMQVADLPRLSANGFHFHHAGISFYILTWTSQCTQPKLAEINLQSNLTILFSSTLQDTCTQTLNSLKVKVQLKFTLKQATKVQRESRGIALFP